MKNTLISFLVSAWQVLRSMRPRQWLKNVVLAAPIIFGGQLFDQKSVISIFIAIFVFCLASSAGYLTNDVVDAPKDRFHPYKKLRPIASGKLAPFLALVIAGVLVLTSMSLAVFYLNKFFYLTLIGFLILQLTYSLILRDITILDSLVVALAFIIRVFAGSFATETSISSWLILATIGISLLLAFGKRRSERTLLSLEGGAVLHPTRQTLTHYPDTLLDSMISMSASFAIISYSLFSFQISPKIQPRFFLWILPPTLTAPKWMMLTIPFVIYGVARYLYVIYEKKEGESPERVLLSDKPLILTIGLWLLITVFIIYFIGG